MDASLSCWLIYEMLDRAERKGKNMHAELFAHKFDSDSVSAHKVTTIIQFKCNSLSMATRCWMQFSQQSSIVLPKTFFFGMFLDHTS